MLHNVTTIIYIVQRAMCGNRWIIKEINTSAHVNTISCGTKKRHNHSDHLNDYSFKIFEIFTSTKYIMLFLSRAALDFIILWLAEWNVFIKDHSIANIFHFNSFIIKFLLFLLNFTLWRQLNCVILIEFHYKRARKFVFPIRVR